eukprot:Em0006g1516a
MSVDQMEGMALAIIFASMVWDHLPAAVYLDTPRLATTALAAINSSHVSCNRRPRPQQSRMDPSPTSRARWVQAPPAEQDGSKPHQQSRMDPSPTSRAGWIQAPPAEQDGSKPHQQSKMGPSPTSRAGWVQAPPAEPGWIQAPPAEQDGSKPHQQSRMDRSPTSRAGWIEAPPAEQDGSKPHQQNRMDPSPTSTAGWCGSPKELKPQNRLVNLIGSRQYTVTANPTTIAYIQVKANGNIDCVAWKTLPAQEVVYKSIKDEMEAFCKCNFTIQSLNLTCSDKTSATLRGLIDKALLSYLEQWVATEATISAPGVTLTVDSTCVVQIQSLDDPFCQAVSSGSLVSNHPYLFVGVACAGVLLIVTMSIVIGAVIRLRKRKQFKINNPLYDASGIILDNNYTVEPGTVPDIITTDLAQKETPF